MSHRHLLAVRDVESTFDRVLLTFVSRVATCESRITGMSPESMRLSLMPRVLYLFPTHKSSERKTEKNGWDSFRT